MLVIVMGYFENLFRPLVAVHNKINFSRCDLAGKAARQVILSQVSIVFQVR